MLDSKKRSNAAWLVAAFSVAVLRRSAAEALRPLTRGSNPPYLAFRDASFSPSTYNLQLGSCVKALEKAIRCGLYDWQKFDVEEYERFIDGR